MVCDLLGGRVRVLCQFFYSLNAWHHKMAASAVALFEQANDRFTYKTGYLPVDGTKLSVKDRFRMGRSGTPYPLWSFAQQT